jgi:site-specific recombinase XerD
MLKCLPRKGEQDHYTRASIAHYVGTLRVFFRYAEQRSWCSRGLAAAIMCPRIFADEGLPKGPSWEDVQRLLAGTEGDHPKGIRDRAIIMLFAVYGLRVGDVRALRLEDLNWDKELLSIRRPKSRRQQTYPFAYTVGQAILRYLKEVRPRTPHREVFLTLRAPIRRRAMTLNEIVLQYVAFRKSMGEDFDSAASLLKTFCRRMGGDIELADITAEQVQLITTSWPRDLSCFLG